MSRKSSEITIDRERFPIDEWRLVETRPGDDTGLTGTLFATGNGYLGLRGDYAPEPISSGTFVNGLHETFSIEYPETAYALARAGQTLIQAPDTKSIQLEIGGQTLHFDARLNTPSRNDEFERTLDFRTGILSSRFVWRPANGGRFEITTERCVSLEHRHVAGFRLTVTALDGAASVTIRSHIANRQDIAAPVLASQRNDPRAGRRFNRRVLVPMAQRHSQPERPDGGTLVLGFRCATSGMTVAVGSVHVADQPISATVADDDAVATLELVANAGQPLTIDKFAAYHTSGQLGLAMSVDELADRCEETLQTVVSEGWDALVASQRAWLDRFWERSDIVVEGDPAAQQAIRWNLFQLAQASAQTGDRGIAAKAVSAGGYDGHYFWDTEVYVLPLLAYTNPAAARRLLGFRYATLTAARHRAAEMSQVGALFPWRTINGQEASAYYPAGTAQYHIDAAVAYAIERYVAATGDIEFLCDEGAEMLVEIARLFADLGFYDGEPTPGFHIHCVTGPDEYTAVVDDNLYTNLMARFTLRYAADVVDALAADEPAAHADLVERTGVDDAELVTWRSAADAMHIGYDADLGINPQDAAFLSREPWDWEGTPPEKYPLLLNFHPLVIYRHQVLKQADVVQAMFMRSEEFEPDLQLRNFDYYDAITSGDSSLSACVQSIVAAQVGRHELARHYFDQSLYLDLADTHGNTVDGTHIANVGGVWAALVHGFAGVRDNGDWLTITPRLPEGWTSMRFRLHRRDSDLEIAVDTEGATVSVVAGSGVVIHDRAPVVLATGESHRLTT